MKGDSQDDSDPFTPLFEFPSLDEAAENDETEESVLTEFQRTVDPRLVDAGWGFEAAKSVEHGKTDQSLVNHVRNGVFALAQLNEVVRRLDGPTLSDEDLRAFIALFTIHDIHKLDRERDSDPESRFDIPLTEVETYVERFELDEFADSLTMRDFHACAVDHHDDWQANPDQTTIRFDDLRPFIRLADSFASCETPEEATNERTQRALDAAYPGAGFELRRHALDDVKGVLTNLVNACLADTLGAHGYERVLIYQDGCVYLCTGDEPVPNLDDKFVKALFDRLRENVRTSHSAYQNPRQLTDNLTTRSQGFYGINDQDFFYAGPEMVLEAVALKGASDADPDSEPTESMAETMAELEEYLPSEILRTREPVGLARFAYTVKRAFVEPVLDATNSGDDVLAATCDVLGVSGNVSAGLESAAAEFDLTAGGKWDYSYGIGQYLVDEGVTDTSTLTSRVVDGLNSLSPEWRTIVAEEHAGNVQTELDTYLRQIVSVDGRGVESKVAQLSDPYKEYPGTRRGKTCVLCNRGTTSSRKSDLKAPKSLTTLQAGYSNHIAVNAGKPDELLACLPCQVELSLRETGSQRREAGRLFIHLVPNYFYTPFTWRTYSMFLSGLSGESQTELNGLAEAVLGIGTDPEALGTFTESLLDEEFGRSMVETLDQGFDPSRHYGARTLSYYKPIDNDTEFQFFGVFVALALGAYTGLRILISESPLPDLRARDYRAYARIGGGFTQVHNFYGTEIPLSGLQSRLWAAAALIRLGYGSKRDDALFPKYLRVTRNQQLPGSHLLKRIAQADDGRSAQYLLEEARVLDQETGVTTTDR